MIEADLVAALSGNAAVAAIIGNRVYPGFAPADAEAPYIVYEVSGGGPLQTSTGPVTTHHVEMHLYCNADSYLQVKELAAAVQSLMDGWTSSTVSAFRLTDRSEAQNFWGDEAVAFTVDLTFSVWYA